MDGLSHWLCIPETHESVKYGACLLSFDWSKEVFIITPTPSNAVDYFPNFSDLSSHLVLLNGSIALAVVYRATTTIHISILGELSVKESWTKIFVVGPLPCLEHPIGAGKKGDMLFKKKDGGLVWFDLNTQMMEDLGVTSSGFRCQIVIH
ncbi:putative F-box associated domain, type 1 [Medicago truncatula]|uniref:F-box associated protein n=1 Tax=Medicago truncatula TaxID=3880 RepID=G7KBN1_MEDTR|nr:F-box associated protein [Medicago truncatula]RHN56266.1 putative F-box associated domain, type 1 [Medicago truncatula]